MKTFWFIPFALSIMSSPVAHAQTLANSGPMTIKIVATTQGLHHALVSSKTNSTAIVTNTTSLLKSTTTNTTLQATDFLRLVENSFNTTLPNGSRLMASRDDAFGGLLTIYVTDSTGTNVVLGLSTNVLITSFLGEQPVETEVRTAIATTTSSGTSFSGHSSDTLTATVVLNYDDSGLTTKDGTHTKFQITCLLVRKSSATLFTEQIKDKNTLDGVGYGTIRDQNVILQGSAAASVSGVLPPLSLSL